MASLSALVHSALVNQFCKRQTGPPGTSASELVPVVEYTQKYLFNIPLPLGIFQLSSPCLVMRKWFIISFICWFYDTLLCRVMLVAGFLCCYKHEGCIFSLAGNSLFSIAHPTTLPFPPPLVFFSNCFY